jgi:ribonuclease T2
MTMKKILAGLGAVVLALIAAWEEGGLDTFVQQQLQTARSDGAAPRTSSATTREERGEGFDYYVLALSWSPSFCEDSGDRSSNQCNGSRDFGFVAHGLWPQNETGWPQNCDVRARVPDRTVDRMLPIMPAKGLIYHQWKKHGTCSGLDPQEYFEVTRAAYDSVVIPPELKRLSKPLVIDPRVIEAAFIEANPEIDADEIVINCSKNRLPRQCGRDVNRECRSDSIRMPPVR